ncbi:MAG: DUF262 domain-containing protein, partial [Thiomargarita sp.]|nr:DUF262 domain-containing protein [Thiomargarita sp.]
MSFMFMEPIINQTFHEMMSNGIKYQIPRFQRDYTWEQEQWEDLWSDIETLPQEKYHYMGYIVLQRNNQHDYLVIDGQQRLITLSLVILAAMKQIDKLIQAGNETGNNQKRLDELGRRFIGATNPISLRVDNKLSLNRNNNRHFREICSKLEAPNIRGLTNTNRLLNKSFEFFLKKSIGDGETIAKFVEQVTWGMVFTKIVVQDDLNAYKIFETLNARGVKLSTPDLLKNTLFSIITKNDDVVDGELDDLDEKWSEIVNQLGETDFTNFIRYHHNFQAKSVTKTDLFASVRRLANSPKTAYEYLDSLYKYAPLYVSLGNPEDEWWNDQDEVCRNAKQYLRTLKTFSIKQPFTVLMVAFFRFTPKEFVKLCSYITILSIRYNVICHFSPSEQEQKYNQMAMKIFYKGELKRASYMKNNDLFKSLYPDDKAFFNAFEFHKMPSRQSSKKIRFILAEIESHLGNPVSETDVSLEHICPYNPTETWIKTFGEGYDEVKDRLGNMLLLSKSANKDLDTKPFAQKKEVYTKSRFKLAEKAASYEEWNKQSVDEFQYWMAEQAVETWKIDF